MLIGLQYGLSAFLSPSHLVNILVSAFGRGLPIVLLFNSNLDSFSHDLGPYALSSSLGSYLHCLSSCPVVTVSCGAVRWLLLVVPFSRLFDMFGDHFRSHLELLRWTSLHSFGTDVAQLIFLSSLLCSCSQTNYPPSRCTGRHSSHLPYARYTYRLQLLVAFPGFAPGMLSTPSHGVLAVTCLGIHIIIFACWLFSMYACWLC